MRECNDEPIFEEGELSGYEVATVLSVFDIDSKVRDLQNQFKSYTKAKLLKSDHPADRIAQVVAEETRVDEIMQNLSEMNELCQQTYAECVMYFCPLQHKNKTLTIKDSIKFFTTFYLFMNEIVHTQKKIARKTEEEQPSRQGLNLFSEAMRSQRGRRQ